jgi:ASC-1-like (ASCH) protein
MNVDLNRYNQILKDKRAPIICINTFKRQKINYGDFINSSNDYNKAEIKVKVVNKATYKTVEKLYKAKRFEISYKTLNELRSYLASNYYSNIDIEKNGLLYFLVYFESND